ncbi:MAG: hypothetical protein ACK5SH_12000, partial [Pseudomonadota bacterium]
MAPSLMLRHSLLALAVAAGLSAAPAFGQSAKEQELENRIAELEKQLGALMAELKAEKEPPQPTPPGTPPPPPQVQATTITPFR